MNPLSLIWRLIVWLLRRVFLRRVTRHAARLAPTDGDDDADARAPVAETVDLRGGPLKEHHRRRALRDPRLLPKTKPPLRLGKRPKIMTADEARRLFGATMRTRNRNLRDLLTDPEQLQRYGLPLWRSEAELATALGLSVRHLRFFSIHRERETAPHYVTFAIPKRSGGQRLIMAPKRRLKAIQRQLYALLVARLPVSEHAHGFRPQRNVRTGAAPHVGQRMVIRLDLRDCFPTITFARVRGLLIAYGYSYPIACTLAALMTESVRQPVAIDGKRYHVPVGPRHCVQGAPTSPGLCNALLLRLDHRLAGLARKFGCTYTRYADDLSFSGPLTHAAAQGLRARCAAIVTAEGFTLNAAKTRVMAQGQRQTVTGVVVNHTLGWSRQDRRRLRAAVHQLALAQHTIPPPSPTRVARIRGLLAYLAMLNPTHAAQLHTHFERWATPRTSDGATSPTP